MSTAIAKAVRFECSNPRFKPDEVAAIGAELWRLSEEKDGGLRPEDVVAAATADPSSPLRKGFTWDDGKAADKCRRQEAAKLLKSVWVVVPYKADGEQRTRRIQAMHLVVRQVCVQPVEEPDEALPDPGVTRPRRAAVVRNERVYVPLKAVCDNSNYGEQVVAQALEELQRAQAKYVQYRDLPAFKARKDQFRKKLEAFMASLDAE